MFLKGIETVRAHEWSRQYLWDINFPDLGIGWFPGVDVEENLATVTNHEVTLYQSTYNVPLGTTAFDLKVTFVEFADHRISKWLTKWMNEIILGNGEYTATVEEAAKLVQLAKLNPDRSVLQQSDYLVYPDGGLYFHGSSESGAEIITQSFQIVGS